MAKTINTRARDAAEEVCFSMLVAIELGLLDELSLENRQVIAPYLQAYFKLKKNVKGYEWLKARRRKGIN